MGSNLGVQQLTNLAEHPSRVGGVLVDLIQNSQTKINGNIGNGTCLLRSLRWERALESMLPLQYVYPSSTNMAPVGRYLEDKCHFVGPPLSCHVSGREGMCQNQAPLVAV